MRRKEPAGVESDTPTSSSPQTIHVVICDTHKISMVGCGHDCCSDVFIFSLHSFQQPPALRFLCSCLMWLRCVEISCLRRRWLDSNSCNGSHSPVDYRFDIPAVECEEKKLVNHALIIFSFANVGRSASKSSQINSLSGRLLFPGLLAEMTQLTSIGTSNR